MAITVVSDTNGDVSSLEKTLLQRVSCKIENIICLAFGLFFTIRGDSLISCRKKEIELIVILLYKRHLPVCIKDLGVWVDFAVSQ